MAMAMEDFSSSASSSSLVEGRGRREMGGGLMLEDGASKRRVLGEGPYHTYELPTYLHIST